MTCTPQTLGGTLLGGVGGRLRPLDGQDRAVESRGGVASVSGVVSLAVASRGCQGAGA